jgi:endonuclease-3
MPRETVKQKHLRAQRIFKALLERYPDAACALRHENAWQLLMATILSAQCTDVRVNIVTPALFKKYPNVKAMAAAKTPELEALVRSTGFFRNKAKSLVASSADIVNRFGGDVPDSMDDLLSLHGVARKTANVVLGNAFGKNVGMVVDTHVGRLSFRMGFTRHTNPEKIEWDIIKLFPGEDWMMLAHVLIFHGRQVCTARNPNCPGCPINDLCPKNGVKKKNKTD